MPFEVRSEEAEGRQVFARDEAGLGPERVEQRRRMALRQNQPVRERVLRVARVEAHLREEQHGHEVRGRLAGSGMPAPGRGCGPDGLDAQAGGDVPQVGQQRRVDRQPEILQRWDGTSEFIKEQPNAPATTSQHVPAPVRTYNREMFVLRYLYILALGVWLGGMAVAGLVAAPTIFAVLEAWNPVQGRILAGQVFGGIVARLHYIFYAAAVVMLVTLTVRRLLGPRPVAYGIRASIIVLMFGLTLASGFGISPRVEAMQREIGGSVADLPESDPRRASFYQLHGLSNVLLSATLVGALLLLFWESREGQS
jgi:hypothetical protein